MPQREVLPDVGNGCSKDLSNGLERDHGHLKQRLKPMRGFESNVSADILGRGHALIRNVRVGFSMVTESVPRDLRLAVAWRQLARTIWVLRRVSRLSVRNRGRVYARSHSAGTKPIRWRSSWS